MVDILKSFNFESKEKTKYTLGKITAVNSNFYSIKMFTGISVTIKEEFVDYSVGDRVIIADFGNLNGAFIVKKVGFRFPGTQNFAISNGEG